jgi:hypothetical protein
MSNNQPFTDVVRIIYCDTSPSWFEGVVVSTNESALGVKTKLENSTRHCVRFFPWKRIATAWFQNKDITSRSEIEIGDSIEIFLRSECQEQDKSIGKFFCDGDFVGTNDSDGTYFVASDLASIKSDPFKDKNITDNQSNSEDKGDITPDTWV